MHEVSYTPWEKRVCQLLILGIFFAMRSCKYLDTRYPEESKRTKILRLKNVVFKNKNGHILKHTSSLSRLQAADIIILTFEFQKNDWRNHSVHLWRTDDPLLCPVKAGARIVKEIWSYPKCTEEFKINTLLTEDGTITNINSAQVLPHLRSIVDLIGETSLGFKSKDIGLYSIRSGGAMAMFQSRISTIIIQQIGRWSSKVFLKYIREQVESFSF